MDDEQNDAILEILAKVFMLKSPNSQESRKVDPDHSTEYSSPPLAG